MSYQNRNKSSSINKVQNLKKQEGKYPRFGLQQFFLCKIGREIYKDLYGDAMLLPIQISINMAAGNQQKHLSLSFATKTYMYLLTNSKTLKQHFF